MGRQMTMGVVVGNRGFFPSHLATSGRLEMVAALEAAGIKADCALAGGDRARRGRNL